MREQKQNIIVTITCDVDVPAGWRQEDIEKYVNLSVKNLNMWGKDEYEALHWNDIICSVRRSEVFEVELNK